MSKFAQFKKLTEAAENQPITTSSETSEQGQEAPASSDNDDQNSTKEINMDNETPIEDTKEYKAGFAAATNRMKAVFASEHFEGREASAAKLLTKDALMSSSADDVSDLLADMGKTEPVAAVTTEQQIEAAENGGRQEMREELQKSKNSNIDPSAGVVQPAANHGWDDIHAEIRETRKI